jgi:hypothetical protein
MALALSVAKLDDVAEAVRGLYVEKDGKFQLDVDGIEDTSGLKSALQAERKAVKDAKDAAKALEEKFAGLDPAKVREMMAKLDQDGEAALIAAGKIDEVIAKRSEKLRAELQRQVDEAQGAVKAANERTTKYSQRVLDDRIKDAVIGKVHVSAIKNGDVMRAAREIFSLDDEGNAIQLGADGKPVLGKDGKTPFSPAEWIESMAEQAPHWFPAGGSGGGSGGSGGGQGGGKTMKRSAFDALPARDKAAAAKAYAIVEG